MSDDDAWDGLDEGARKTVEMAHNAFMSERRIRPAVVHDRANEAKEDYLALEVPGTIYRLIRDDIASVWGLLESPIEQVAIFHLASENYGRDDWPIYAKVARKRGLFDHGNYPVQIIPQVAFGRHRVDFLIDLGFRGLVAIECDGADYHQDKAKDEARDRDLREQHGIKVFRVAGTDIWRDNAMISMWAEMIRLYLKWGSTRG
jgi:hypothetical protein